jgi:hypothetical protein
MNGLLKVSGHETTRAIIPFISKRRLSILDVLSVTQQYCGSYTEEGRKKGQKIVVTREGHIGFVVKALVGEEKAHCESRIMYRRII